MFYLRLSGFYYFYGINHGERLVDPWLYIMYV